MTTPLEKPKRRPTARQKRAVKEFIENETKAQPRPVGEVLKDVGYSDTIAKRPSTIIQSKGFQYLLKKEGVTDELLTVKLKEGLDADKPFGKDGDIHADYATRHKYLDTALKLKGIQATPGTAPAKQAIYNTQINQTNLDPNSDKAKDIINNTLDILMKETKAE